jgi:hypothetical protein
MILYHFTCPWVFWGADWKSGVNPNKGCLSVETPDLLPSNRQYADCDVSQWRIPVVWLTTSTETRAAESPNTLRLRLTVKLPSTDHRLHSFAKWWPRAGLETPLGMKKAVPHWWTYRGTIPARAIVDAQLMLGQRPWWEEEWAPDEIEVAMPQRAAFGMRQPSHQPHP